VSAFLLETYCLVICCCL